MKKLFYFSAAALTSLFAASCASDDVPEINADGMTSFQVQLPEGLDTRDFGDGNSATQLYVAIYDAAGEANAAPLFSNFPGGALNGMEVTNFNGRKATVTVNLVKNKQYNIVLWAQNGAMSETATDNAFNYTPTARTIQVNYGKLVCNTEDADAFYSYETYTSTPTASKTFTLYRPFAQINIGTDDLQQAANAGMEVTEAGMEVTNVANVLDLSTGTATGDETVTYAPKTLPTTTDGTFPANTKDKTYSYLTMGYVLVPGDKTAKGTTEVSLNVNGQPQNPFAKYPNVPVQANYRTNIYGSLLTNPEVFNVTIEPAFNTPANNREYWDGTVVPVDLTLAGEDKSNPIEITSAGQLAWIIQNASKNSNFEGYTFKLNSDLYLNGNPLAKSNYATFKGTLDGQNHTINGLNSYLFYTVDGGTVKNLVIDNANITSGGTIANTLNNGGKIENVTVNDNCTIKGYSQIGGIVGFVQAATVNNCTNNATVIGVTQVGGIVGRSFSGTITNSTNTGNVVVENTASKSEGIGGIIGQQLYGGLVTGCTNTGNIEVNSTNDNSYGAGGIIGWIRYSTGSWPNPNTGINGIVEVSECENSGSVSTLKTGAGGIVGMVFIGANVHNNTNTASSIHAGGVFAAGIVGGFQYDPNKPNDWPKRSYFPYLSDDPVCDVKDNVSTTPLENITGSCNAPIVYTNNSPVVHLSGNTPEQK